MSIEAVSEFLQKVSNHEELQRELIEVMEFNENDQLTVTELAAKYGFDFTPNELLQQVEELQDNQQLDDEELEYVVGGNSLRAWNALGNLIGIFSGEMTLDKTKENK